MARKHLAQALFLAFMVCSIMVAAEEQGSGRKLHQEAPARESALFLCSPETPSAASGVFSGSVEPGQDPGGIEPAAASR